MNTKYIKSFSKLTNIEVFQICKARIDVFVVEQNCVYPDLDDIDIAHDTAHVVIASQGNLQAYARCYLEAEQADVCKIGRVLVLSEARDKGVAGQLMQYAMAHCQKQWPDKTMKLSAQTYLVKFYQSLGFEPVGEAYLEDGIEHIDMLNRSNI